jgi:hypothetical protein
MVKWQLVARKKQLPELCILLFVRTCGRTRLLVQYLPAGLAIGAVLWIYVSNLTDLIRWYLHMGLDIRLRGKVPITTRAGESRYIICCMIFDDVLPADPLLAARKCVSRDLIGIIARTSDLRRRNSRLRHIFGDP